MEGEEGKKAEVEEVKERKLTPEEEAAKAEAEKEAKVRGVAVEHLRV